MKAVGMVPAVKVSPVFSRDWHGGGDELVVLNGERREYSFGVNEFHSYGI